MPKAKDLTGQRFGRLTAISAVQGSGNVPRKWLCQCDCGKTITVITRDLGNGNTTSCGCYIRELHANRLRTHGKTRTPTYNIWASMTQRCGNPNNDKYQYYGGRGITVCERWHSFENFLADMGERPLRHSLDRIDNNRPYSPDNCRWTTMRTQNRNRRSNILVEYRGETMCLVDWADRLGANYETLRQRIQDYGWTVEEAFSKPPQSRELHITHDGETLTLEQWEKRTGLASNLIYNRIHSKGWSIEKALTTPKIVRRERTSLGQWAKA